jgi:hypothetical protein
LEHRNYLSQPQNPDYLEMEHEELPQQVHELLHEKEWHMVEIGDHRGKEAREPFAQETQQDAVQVCDYHLVDQKVYKILKSIEKFVMRSKCLYQKLQQQGV